MTIPIENDVLRLEIGENMVHDSVVGSVTPTTSDYRLYIPCDIENPKLILVYADDVETLASPDHAAASGTVGAILCFPSAYRYTSGAASQIVTLQLYAASAGTGYTSTLTSNFSAADGIITINTGASARKFLAGVKYNYRIFP